MTQQEAWWPIHRQASDKAIHEAFHRCSDSDPYDSSTLDPELLGTYSNGRSKERGAAYRREMTMLPTVDHVKNKPVDDFEVVSRQTNDARGEMPPEKFIAYCLLVVQITDQH